MGDNKWNILSINAKNGTNIEEGLNWIDNQL